MQPLNAARLFASSLSEMAVNRETRNGLTTYRKCARECRGIDW
ncbi:hypothetical protein [Salinivibrio socompensis]